MKESRTYIDVNLKSGCHMSGVSGRNPRSFVSIDVVVIENELKSFHRRATKKGVTSHSINHYVNSNND
jgi:hypothetical protein